MHSLEIVKQHEYDSNFGQDYDRLLASLHLTDVHTHNPEKIKSVCRGGTGNLYLGIVDSRAVAIGVLVRPFGSIGHRTAVIEDVAVDPDFRGLKIGSRILAFMEAEATRLGATRIELHSSEIRVEAHKLYLGSGYNIIDTCLFRKVLAIA